MRALRVRRLSIIGLAGVLLFALTACEPIRDTYVALGDSYAAGPLIPDQSTEPLGCLRSDHNYAHLVSPSLGLAKFVDVTCSGAETEDMFNTQGVTPGPNPAQLNSVDAKTKIVTLQIGGNDIGFSGIVKDCVNLNPWGTPCKNQFATPSGDELVRRINATAPLIRDVINGIKAKAPKAKVFVLGYPTILPDTGTGCWPVIPILGADVTYLRGIEKQLNSMIAQAASSLGATYVDIYTPTIGHDACSGDRWVEALVPTSVAAPVHPNAAGMRAQADVLRPILQAAASAP